MGNIKCSRCEKNLVTYIDDRQEYAHPCLHCMEIEAKIVTTRAVIKRLRKAIHHLNHEIENLKFSLDWHQRERDL